MESSKGFLGNGLMEGLLIEMRTEFREAERDVSLLGSRSCGEPFHPDPEGSGEGGGNVAGAQAEMDLVTPWQGVKVIPIFLLSYLLPVSLPGQVQVEPRGSLDDATMGSASQDTAGVGREESWRMSVGKLSQS